MAPCSMTFRNSRTLPGQGWRLKRLHGLARHLGDLLAHARGEFLEEGPDQHRDVLGPLAQRRHADGKHVEPVVEIFPEAPVAQILGQVTVGGRDDSDVHVDGFGAAQSLELAFLQDAQQLGLHFERQLANLIQEDRGTVRDLETSDLSRQRPGERALLAAEEFAFHQGRGERGAVDFDHQVPLARAEAMDGLGDEFLARACFAADEHRRIRGRDLLDLAEHLPDGAAAADDLAVSLGDLDLRLQVIAFGLEPLPEPLVLGHRLPQGLVGHLSGQRVGKDLGDHGQTSDDLSWPRALLAHGVKGQCAKKLPAG